MYESARLKVNHVRGPRRPLTAADLQLLTTKRWTVRRKAEVSAAVHGGLLSLDETCRRYALNKRSSYPGSVNLHPSLCLSRQEGIEP
jgi:hypothetical protein